MLKFQYIYNELLYGIIIAINDIMDKKINLKDSNAISYIAYFNICILWGTSNLATKIGVGSLNTSVFACFRYLITGIVLMTITVFCRKKLPKSLKQWGILAVIAILMNFLTNGCVVMGNKFIDSGVATMLLATVPIFTTIIECFILRTYKLSKLGWLGVLGGFIGIVIIVFYGASEVKIDIRGILLVLIASLFWSIGSIYSKEKKIEGSMVAHTGIEAILASSLFFIIGNMLGDFDLAPVSFQSLLPVLYLAIVDSLIGFMSYIYLLKIWKSSKVCTYAYVNPVVAVILGALILNETITVGKILGMIIIILSVILIQKDKDAKIENCN